ncbi:MAG: MBL fold metallo-hydrolase [Thaumarchaeota archaeon]|nr:MBL fold metallo-hydrolase [Nitrososphaerota archaeon]
MSAEKVNERVYLLDTMALGQPGTVAAYLIKGPKPALVDCGYASSFRTVLEEITKLGVPPNEIRYLIPTHVHLDHAGAAGALLKEMPRAEVLAHGNAVPHLVDPRKLIQSATRLFGEAIMEAYGSPTAIPAERVTVLGDQQQLDLGDRMTVTVLYAPGHAPHQVALLLEEEKLLLTADAVGIVYPNMKILIPTTPPPNFEPEKLLHTVDMLVQTTPVSLLVPHFGIRSDVDKVFEQTKSRVSAWLDKVTAMRSRGLSFDDIVDAMTTEVETEAGSELPIYARLSVRVSVAGITHYLEHRPD